MLLVSVQQLLSLCSTAHHHLTSVDTVVIAMDSPRSALNKLQHLWCEIRARWLKIIILAKQTCNCHHFLLCTLSVKVLLFFLPIGIRSTRATGQYKQCESLRKIQIQNFDDQKAKEGHYYGGRHQWPGQPYSSFESWDSGRWQSCRTQKLGGKVECGRIHFSSYPNQNPFLVVVVLLIDVLSINMQLSVAAYSSICQVI